MRVAIPHNHPNDVVRERLKSRTHEVADTLPGNATVRTDWPTPDRMTMAIGVMGQTLDATVDLEPGQLVFDVPLPGALSFVEPMIRGAIEKQGQKLLT